MAPSFVTLTVVLANIGNVNVPACNDQAFKLCQRPVEQRAAQAFQALRPDVTALIEVLPPDLCQRAPSANPANLCSGPLDPPSQVDRIFGGARPQHCDDRYGWDCLTVDPARVRLAPVFDTRPSPASCDDDGFTVNVGRVRVRGWPVTVTVAHPHSSSVPCRADQVLDLFEQALPADGAAIVAGDFNLDPFREEDASVEAFRAHVPSRFTWASDDTITSVPAAPSQTDPTGTTLDNDTALDPPGPLGQRTIDHVVVGGGVRGGCEVKRVDGGGGMDHRAQVCRLDVPTPEVRVRRRGCRVGVTFSPAPPAGLQAVRFSVGHGPRVVTDRTAPYAARVERTTAVRVRPVLANGRGPVSARQVRHC